MSTDKQFPIVQYVCSDNSVFDNGKEAVNRQIHIDSATCIQPLLNDYKSKHKLDEFASYDIAMFIIENFDVIKNIHESMNLKLERVDEVYNSLILNTKKGSQQNDK